MENGVMGDTDTEVAHVRSLPSDYVDFQDQSYDPNYISDISQKMQVPDRICVDHGNEAGESAADFDAAIRKRFTAMNVPDRIIVAGDNQHIGLREGIRRLPMDRDIHAEVPTMVDLATPPRILTLEQQFPSVDTEDRRQARHSQDRQLTSNGHLAAPVAAYMPGVSPNDSVLLNEEDEATLLRTQVAKLTRRVTLVEHDAQRRAQREMGLYVALFGYAIWKFVVFFFRNR